MNKIIPTHSNRQWVASFSATETKKSALSQVVDNSPTNVNSDYLVTGSELAETLPMAGGLFQSNLLSQKLLPQGGSLTRDTSKEYRQWLKLYKPTKPKERQNPILMQLDRVQGRYSRPKKSNSVSMQYSSGRNIEIPDYFVDSCRQITQLQKDRMRHGGQRNWSESLMQGSGMQHLSLMEQRSKAKLNTQLSQLNIARQSPPRGYPQGLKHKSSQRIFAAHQRSQSMMVVPEFRLVDRLPSIQHQSPREDTQSEVKNSFVTAPNASLTDPAELPSRHSTTKFQKLTSDDKQVVENVKKVFNHEVDSMQKNLVNQILNRGYDKNPFERVQRRFDYRVSTPEMEQTELNQTISQTDLSRVAMPVVPLEYRDQSLEYGDSIKQVKEKMFGSIDRQIKVSKIRQSYEKDLTLYDRLMQQRQKYRQQPIKKAETRMHVLFKDFRGNEATRRWHAQWSKLEIPDFKIVKKIRGTDVVINESVKSNKDIVRIFKQDLEDKLVDLREPVSDRVMLEEAYQTKYANPLSDVRKDHQLITGAKAVQMASQVYQKADKIAEKFALEGKTSTPYVDYFNEIQKNGMLPKGKGLVRSKHSDQANCVDLSQFYIRKEQAVAISKGFDMSQFIRRVNLRNCGLKDETFAILLNKLDPYYLQEIDISHNALLTAQSYQLIADLIVDRRCELRVLECDSNNMGDENAIKLIDALRQVNYIETLDLSQNRLTDESAKQIGELIEEVRSLKVLLLKYNSIKGRGGIAIAKGIQFAEKLQIFDISFNSICGLGYIEYPAELRYPEEARKRREYEEAKEVAKQSKANKNDQPKRPKPQVWATMFAEFWRDCFRENRSLLHVDLSHNRIKKIDSEIIGEGLKANHVILGLHWEGNYGYVDQQGFVQPGDEEFAESMMSTKIPKALKAGALKNPLRRQLQVDSNCWVCEGWSQVKFTFKPGISDDTVDHDPFKAIKLHLELEQYQGDLMLPDPGEDGTYVAWRMLPPGTHKYFYSVANVPKVALDQPSGINDYNEPPPKQPKLLKNLPEKQVFDIDKTYFSNVKTREKITGQAKSERQDNSVQEAMKKAKLKKKLEKWDDDEPNYLEVDIPFTNILESLKQTTDALDKSVLASRKAVPRPEPKDLGGREKLRTPWKLNNSVFKDYKQDTQKLLDECFEQDWKNSKIDRIVKDEDEQGEMRKLLKANYLGFRESYKQLSGIDPQKDLTAIGVNTFSEVVNSLPGFIDGKNMNLADLDLEFISTNANGKPGKRNPERMLVRHNWMEIFVRLATTRYVKKEKVAKNPTEAINMLLGQQLNKFFSKFEAAKWRKEVLHREEIDLTLKRALSFLKQSYQKFSGRFANPGTPNFMSLIEFQELFQDSGIFNENFGAKQLPAQFAVSMMTNVDELDQDRHMSMSFSEFVEAFVRVAEQLTIPHLVLDKETYTLESVLDGLITDEDKAQFARRPLPVKIESLIFLLNAIHFPKTYGTLKTTIEKYKKIGVKANDIDPGNLKF